MEQNLDFLGSWESSQLGEGSKEEIGQPEYLPGSYRGVGNLRIPSHNSLVPNRYYRFDSYKRVLFFVYFLYIVRDRLDTLD